MAHPEQAFYVNTIRNKFPKLFKNKRVLEVGSLDINGTVRIFFKNCEYVGIDVGEGPGVDVVSSGHEYKDNPFDVCISCECFEHNPFWKETFLNMYSLCKSNGLLLFTCATTGRPEHGTTRTTPGCSPLTISNGWDYYKNLTDEDFADILNFSSSFTEYEFSNNKNSCDLYFYGIKK